MPGREEAAWRRPGGRGWQLDASVRVRVAGGCRGEWAIGGRLDRVGSRFAETLTPALFSGEVGDLMDVLGETSTVGRVIWAGETHLVVYISDGASQDYVWVRPCMVRLTET